MKVLFIGDNDLISKRFNGYDYHDMLKNYNIESSMLVEHKLSNADFVQRVDSKIDNFTIAIIKNKLFLEADIIHLHLIHNTPFDINYLPVITRLKPTVITLHDPFFLSGHCIHHFSCKKWKIHCVDCEYLDIPLAVKYDDTALKFFIKEFAIKNAFISAIVASGWLFNLIKQSPIWKEKNIYKLPFGVDQNVFKPADIKIAKKKLGIKDDTITLMFRSQNNIFKGMDIIKYALDNIQTEKKITLITVGETGLLNELKNKFIIKEYEWTTDDNFLSQLYQASDIFLMPSKQEAFGLMAIEAMSCGKMVLTTKNTALEYTTNHPDCGFAVEHNATIFTQELQRLLNNMDEVKKRGKKSHEFVQNTYRQEVFFTNLLCIYKETIEKHHLSLAVNEKENMNLVVSQLCKYNNDYQNISIVSKKTMTNPIKQIFRLIKRKLCSKIKLF
ncbi:MAG: glycosyltransferase [Spirochaetes bacterium]|nr:glycosyltransferase [Spirochaetota bacterium]